MSRPMDPPQLNYSLTATDTSGDPLTGDIVVGDTFLLNVWVEDGLGHAVGRQKCLY